VTFPSAERLVIGRLLEAPPLVDGRVVPKFDEIQEFPAIVVPALVGGGILLLDVWDGGRVQLDAYGDTKLEAHDVAQDARARLLATPGGVKVWPADGSVLGVVSAITETLAPRWTPEPNSGRPRYTFEVRVYARAVSALGT
jgi:hypothetical protein